MQLDERRVVAGRQLDVRENTLIAGRLPRRVEADAIRVLQFRQRRRVEGAPQQA